MAEYYFDGLLGDNGLDGLTPGTAKKDASSVTFGALDACLLKAGNPPWVAPTGTQAINLPQSGNRVGAYGAGDYAPIIDCSQVERGISIGTDRVNCVIEDVRITNVQGGTNRRGITNTTTGSSETVPVNLKIRRVVIDNVKTDGANDCNGIMLWGQGIDILDCDISDIATDGIWLRARNASIGKTKIKRVAQDDAVRGAFGDCLQFGGAGASDFSNAHVWGCDFDHTSSKNVKNTLIINAASGTSGIMIEDNVFRTSTVANQIGLFIDVAGATVRGNRVIGGDYGILVGSNAAGAKVYGNDVSKSNFGIRLGGTATGVSIRHNYVHDNAVGCYGSNNDSTTEFMYNLIRDNVVGIQRHGSMVEDYNWLYNTTNFQSLGGGGSIGANGWLTDPSRYFNSDGSLRTEGYTLASPNPYSRIAVYRSGVLLLNGRMRPGWCPVGAYRFVLPRSARVG